MKTILMGLLCAAMWAQTGAPAADPNDPAKLRAEVERDRKILQDWANLDRYRLENERTQPVSPGENRVVFMGDSITDGWAGSTGNGSRRNRTSIEASAGKPPHRCSSASGRM